MVVIIVEVERERKKKVKGKGTDDICSLFVSSLSALTITVNSNHPSQYYIAVFSIFSKHFNLNNDSSICTLQYPDSLTS